MTDTPELLWQLKADLARKDAEIKRLRAERDAALRDFDDLHDEYNDHQEKVSADFEGDCWIALRNLLTKTGWTDWTDPDGVTAEQAYEYLAEGMDNVDAELAAAKAEIERLRAVLIKALSRLDDTRPGKYSAVYMAAHSIRAALRDTEEDG